MTPTNLHDTTSEDNRFRLAKYFAMASFLVIIVFSFPFSMFVSNKAKEVLLESYENTSLLLGQNLVYQVFQNFSLPVLSRFGEIKLSDIEQRQLMDRVVKNIIHSFNVEVVNLYSIDQNIIAYSTSPEFIEKAAINTTGYQKALKGEPSSDLIADDKGIFGIGIEKIGNEKKIRTYIPFTLTDRTTGSSLVVGVFELIMDMTEQYESIVKFQYLIFGLSTLIMAFIFFALLFIVRKAEMIIEQRAMEQRKLEAQLHLAERLSALGEMVAGVSHEIKTPLGIIQSTAELLSNMPNTDDAQKRLSGVIREESIRLNGIVTEFLDFARPQEPSLEECLLEDIIDKNLSFLAPEIEKKGITVNNRLDGRPYRLMADENQLYRAIMNILINAIQSMDHTGYITIKAEKEKRNYRLEIEDTGNGISKENLKKIFNPFFTTKEKGSGLGLPIVKKIIEGHKGTMDIESGLNFGTRVIIRLPKIN